MKRSAISCSAGVSRGVIFSQSDVDSLSLSRKQAVGQPGRATEPTESPEAIESDGKHQKVASEF